jgi:hypothetical protein
MYSHGFIDRFEPALWLDVLGSAVLGEKPGEFPCTLANGR